MRRLFSAWLLGILVLGFFITSSYTVSAQKVIEARLPEACKKELYEKPDFLKNRGSYSNIFNIQANLPFVPTECGLDNGGLGPDGKTSGKPETTAIPVKYFPFVLLRVYNFIISLAFYLFGLGLIIIGITIQTGVLASNYDYYTKLKRYLSNAIQGIVIVLFAYYIVYTILWIFNADAILNDAILK
jgi:hypothetical protein